MVIPKRSAPLATKLCVVPPKVLEVHNVLEVLYHRAKFGWARISSAAGATKTLSFLSVCLHVRHAFERQSLCADFAMKALEYRNDFDTVG